MMALEPRTDSPSSASVPSHAGRASQGGHTATASSGRRPWGWASSGRRVPLDSTRLFLPSRPRYQTALRAAGQVERKRWLYDQVSRRLAGLGLLLLALLVGFSFGCAGQQPHGDLQIEHTPLGGTAPAAGTSGHHTAREEAQPTGADNAVVGLADPGAAPADAEEPLIVEESGGAMAAPPDQDQAQAGGPRVHVIERGDTLFSLAREYYGDDARWRDIAEANDLTRESTIYVGQELRIPEAGSGASVATDSASYNVSANDAPSTGVIAEAEGLIERGSLRDARELLSAHLYQLGGEEEVAALHLLSALNMELLGNTGPEGDCLIHVVERGENLYRISRHYGCTWQSIVKLNGMRDTRIFPGQELKILHGTPQLVLDTERGFLDLWLDEHFIKRYAVRIDGSTASSAHNERDQIKRKRDNPGGDLGTRALELESGLTLHGGSANGVALETVEIEELYDILLVGTAVTVR